MGIEPVYSPYVLGIDLGTSTSCAAVYHRGQSKVIPIAGRKITPSVVHVKKDDGTILVGDMAKAKMLVDPANTVASVKRHMGEDDVFEFAGRPGEKFTPADVSAEILKALVNGVQDQSEFDFEGTVRDVVICVPANFDDRKKKATLEAAEKADLNVIRLLEEPVAASIDFGFEREAVQTILVYDLGGGTFDVSILNVETAGDGDKTFSVKAKEGIPKLGGDDFDHVIMKLIDEKFLAETGVDLLDLEKDQGINTKSLREAQQRLKDAAEAAKKHLDDHDEAPVELPNLVKDEKGKVHSLDVTVSKEDFNAGAADLLGQSKAAVEKALQAAAMDIEDISRIVLVGGSTRMPLVKSMIKEMFGKDAYTATDPDIAVACGAAIFGATLPREGHEVSPEEGQVPIINNIVTHNLGIALKGRKFSKIIEKNTELPSDNPVFSATQTYTTPRDDANQIIISVYQAADDIEYVTQGVCIGELVLGNIPSGPAGSQQIKVTFSIDNSNLLKVDAECAGADGVAKSLQTEIK